ncbi:MAG: hypothetical protein Ct9H300mP14_07180 [Gammaproteobacteria bacterium]|nr:MAG: hypothetical protein Ct9H300mP14_07180 [Gammaproteobacteria bacterium]
MLPEFLMANLPDCMPQTGCRTDTLHHMLTEKDVAFRMDHSGAAAVITTGAETAKFQTYLPTLKQDLQSVGCCRLDGLWVNQHQNKNLNVVISV